MSRRTTTRPAATRALLVAATTLVLASSAGCSLFGGDDDEDGGASSTSVFEVEVGTCAVAPAEVQADVTDVDVVACDQPHDLEVFAKPVYEAVDPGADPETFPGEQELDGFAQGACAEAFTDYVGIPYAQSDYFFTYLLPSARSWQEPDKRYALCFLSTNGEQVERSLKGAAT